MSTTRTPTYRLEITESGFCTLRTIRAVWRGRATQQRLDAWLQAYVKSLCPGGVNAHVSKALGYIPYPSALKIIRQSTGDCVAEWKAAPFQLWH